jgi:hypothetical protein
MKKIIYIRESQLKKILEDEKKNGITKYRFRNRIITFIKELLKNPTHPNDDEELNKVGLSSDDIIKKLLSLKIISKINSIKEVDGKSVYTIQYKVAKKNFEYKIDSLYDNLIKEKKIVSESSESVNEDGAGGATSCGGVGAIGGFDSSGQYTVPLFSTISRNFWNVKRKNKKRKRK